LYQPPPFKTKEVALISFLTFVAAHFGQTEIGSSVNFWISSNLWPQSGQAYS
jgi:hypothetical protein